jgi:hypothetical protein
MKRVTKIKKLPLTVRIFSINCSAIIPELGTLSGLRVRVMLPDALIMAICSPPPCNPRVRLLTREYLLVNRINTSLVKLNMIFFEKNEH